MSEIIGDGDRGERDPVAGVPQELAGALHEIRRLSNVESLEDALTAAVVNYGFLLAHHDDKGLIVLVRSGHGSVSIVNDDQDASGKVLLSGTDLHIQLFDPLSDGEEEQ